MKNYTIIDNDYFEFLIPKKLIDYGKEVLKYSTAKLKEFLTFFNEKKFTGKIKDSFLISREDFISRIREVTFDEVMLPPEWATGSFYGREVQILIDVNNPYDKFTTLSHESFHIMFSKFVYEKNNFERVVWLEEALANNFDGTTEKLIKNNTFKNLISELIHNDKLPKMSDLSFEKGNIVTKEYNGYDLFKVVGRYLIETKKDLLTYINDMDKVIKDGDKILEDSLNYFMIEYNIV